MGTDCCASTGRSQDHYVKQGGPLRASSLPLAIIVLAAVVVCTTIFSGSVPARADTTERVSLDSSEHEWVGPFNPLWQTVSVSADGRFVAFDSEAANLVPGDTNWVADIFVRDRQAGTTERVSVSSSGQAGSADSWRPSISGDGRFVAFMSFAPDLAPNDANNSWDILVRDRQRGATELVSVGAAGMPGAGHSWWPSINADGRFVAFESEATDLVPGDTNERMDIFVRDRTAQTTERVSVSSQGAESQADSFQPAISADGRFVAFMSYASNLVPGDGNSSADVFVHDRLTGATERVSVSTGGSQANADAKMPAISFDGRFVTFESYASTLASGDSNARIDIFVRDRLTGTTERVSVSSRGRQANEHCHAPSISADGRFVAFESYSSNLADSDNNRDSDVFVRDRTSGTTERASLNSSDTQGNADSGAASISADGRFVAFWSHASNLVGDDRNSVADVFVRHREGDHHTLHLTGEQGRVKVNGTPHDLPWSGEFFTGTVAVLEAEETSYLEFVGWSGDLSGDENPVTITINSDKNIGAAFNLIGRTLTVNNIAGCGSIRVNGELVSSANLPWARSFAYGAMVTLEAEPCECWEFEGWTGDISGSADTVSMALTQNLAVGASFTEIIYSLSLTGTGSGSVRVNGTIHALPWSDSFTCGSDVTLEAVPADCWQFAGWSRDATGSASPITISMDGDKTIAAGFSAKGPQLLTLTGAGSGSVRVNGTRHSLPWSGSFACGSEVTLQAESDYCWEFLSWSGDATGDTNPITLTLDDPKSVEAHFGQLGPYSLALTGVGSGSVRVGGTLHSLPWTGSFACGTQLTLAAEPQYCWGFDGWSGDLVGGASPVSITMDANMSIAASFSQLGPYSLTVTGVGSGSVRVDGELRSLPWTESFDCGTEVALQAEADSCWDFGGWSGDATGSGNPVIVTVDDDKSVEAQFNQLGPYSLTVTGVGTGSVRVDGTLRSLPWSGSFACGSLVSLQAESDACSTFNRWSGDASGSTNPVSITMEANKAVTAQFDELGPYALTLSGTGSGSVRVDGTLHSLPWSGSFDCGRELTLEAAPESCWKLQDWSGDVVGSASPISLTMDADKTVAAHFVEAGPYSLTLTSVGSGSVRVNGELQTLPWSGTFACASQVSLEAQADDCWTFPAWSGDASGSTTPVTITMDGDKTVEAQFVQLGPYSLTVTGTGSGSVRVNGTLHSLPWSDSFACGSQVALEAQPEACWIFEEWSGDAAGATNPINLTMDSDTEIAASFGSLVLFTDVPCGHWAVSAIAACHDAGIALGYPDGSYLPGGIITRGPMAVFISRALAGGDALVPAGPDVASFTDVPTDSWLYNYVEYVKSSQIVQGYPDGSYQPDVDLDRGQMAVFIARALVDPPGEEGLLGYTPPEVPTFPDVNTDFWAYTYIEYIASRHVTQGYPDGTYHPELVCTRDQMAVYISRAFDLPM